MLIWRTTTKFYAVRLEKDLFGDLCLRVRHGSRRTRNGQERVLFCRDVAHAREQVLKIGKARRAHGYVFGEV